MALPPSLCSSSHGGPVTTLFTLYVQYLLRASWGQTPFWVLREVACKALGLVRGRFGFLRLPGHPHGFSPAWPGQVNRCWAGRVPRTPLGPVLCCGKGWGGSDITTFSVSPIILGWAGPACSVCMCACWGQARVGSSAPDTRLTSAPLER